MTSRSRILALAATLVFSLTALADWNDMRATDLLDKEVLSRDGEELGEIRELVIDMRTGRLHYVVLALGGTLGVGERLVPYPVRALSPGKEADNVVLDARPDTLANAAGFPRERWPAWNDPMWDRAERPNSDPSTSAGGTAFDSQKQFLRTFELLGREVHDAEGRVVGKIDDLVLDLRAARVSQVAIGRPGEGRFFVPMNRLHRQAGAPGQPLILERD